MKLTSSEIKLLKDKEGIINNPQALLTLMDKVKLCDKDSADTELYGLLDTLYNLLNRNIDCYNKAIFVHKNDLYEQMIIDRNMIVATASDLLISLSDQSMKGQLWYINRMKTVGYSIHDGGHCFGMSHMAMQAFLAEDMQTFNDRLSVIERTPVEDFETGL